MKRLYKSDVHAIAICNFPQYLKSENITKRHLSLFKIKIRKHIIFYVALSINENRLMPKFNTSQYVFRFDAVCNEEVTSLIIRHYKDEGQFAPAKDLRGKAILVCCPMLDIYIYIMNISQFDIFNADKYLFVKGSSIKR